MTRLADRIKAHFERDPQARLTTHEAVEEFGPTAHGIRESMLRLRRAGFPVRCVRVYQLRNRTGR